MVGVCFDQLPVFRLWLCRKLGIPNLMPMSTTIAVLNGDDIAAVAAYSRFIGPDCWITIAGEGRWLTKSIVPLFFKYPFNHLGCRRLSAFCRESNVHAIEFAKRFGFRQEGVMRAYFEDGENCVVLGLLREDCQWIRESQ